MNPSDVDKFGNFESRRLAWDIERRHLQQQLQRERWTQQAKKHLAADESKRRRDQILERKKLAENAAASYQTTQEGIEAQAKTLRKVAIVHGESARQMRHEAELDNLAGARAFVDQRDHAALSLLQQHGSEHWKLLNAKGAKEYALERQRERERMKRALRGLKWAKEDREMEATLESAAKPPRVPQSPGQWRADTMSIRPGPWRSSQVDAQVEQAKKKAIRAHSAQRQRIQNRQAATTGYIELLADTSAKVSMATYDAWRLKVDATRSSVSDYNWPDKKVHRLSSQVSPRPPLPSPTRTGSSNNASPRSLRSGGGVDSARRALF